MMDKPTFDLEINNIHTIKVANMWKTDFQYLDYKYCGINVSSFSKKQKVQLIRTLDKILRRFFYLSKNSFYS